MEKQEGKGRVMPSLPTPGGNPNPEKKKAAVGRDKRAGEGRGLFARWWVGGLLCSAVLVSGSEGGGVFDGALQRAAARLLLTVSLLFGFWGLSLWELSSLLLSCQGLSPPVASLLLAAVPCLSFLGM